MSAILWITAVLISLLLAGWAFKRWVYIRVPEMAVGVVYHPGSQKFIRFLPPGSYQLLPFFEKMTTMISTAPGVVNGHSTHVQTIGGLSLGIEWTLSFMLNPFKISADSQPRLARSLPTKADKIAYSHVNNCIRYVIGEYTIEDLCRPGVQKRLERQVRQLAAERLAPFGFEVSRVMIGTIEMPPHVRAALEAAHDRQMQIENEAKALAHLQKVISQFSDDDMQRLMELERIHAMGQNGVALPYPFALERDTASKPINSYTRLAARREVVAPGVS